MGGGRKKKNMQGHAPWPGHKNPTGAATTSNQSTPRAPEQKKDPLSFYERFLKLKSGAQLDSWLLQIRVQEVFRMKEGIFYVRNHSVEESKSKCLRNVSFWEMALSLIENDGFRFENEKDIPGIFFGRMESLELNPHRTGKGMILPYIRQEGDVNLDNVLKNDGVDLKKMLQLDDAEAMSYFSFPGSLISSHIVPGAGVGAVTLFMLGVPQTWIIVAAQHFEKVQGALLKELKELGLDDKDPLLAEGNDAILKKECIVLAPSFYKRHDIPFKIDQQDSGSLRVFKPNSIRFGISHGVNLARAVVSKSLMDKMLAKASGKDEDSGKIPKGSQEKKDSKMKATDDGKPTSSSAVTSSALDTDRVPESAGKDSTELTSGLNDLNLK